MAGAAKNKHPEGCCGKDLRPDGAVRRVRLQQVALGGVCAAGVSHGVAEDALSGGVYGGTADQRNFEAGECGQVHLGVQGDEHPGGAAGCAGVVCELYADSDRAGEAIGFGLAAIKNVGHNAIESIIAARALLEAEGKKGFASLWEFCEKVDLRLLNKRVLESLIKAGAMDAFGARASIMAALDKAMEGAAEGAAR